jgi:hypothetical protein
VEGLWSASHSDCFTPKEGALNVHWIEGKVSYKDSLGVVAKGKKKICPCLESNLGYPNCNHHVTNLAIMALQIVGNMMQRYTKNVFKPTALSLVYGGI